MADRYFSSQPISAEQITLEGDEARHLARVMRAQPGDEAVVFDGSGAEFLCEVATVGRNAVQLFIRERREITKELPVHVTLAVSLPKGDRQRWLIEKLTELGAARLQPLRTERSVAQPSANALERLRRGVIEASKQCGRNRLLEISDAADWTSFVRDEETTPHPDQPCLVADPSGADPFATTILGRQLDKNTAALQLTIAIGPEGGFSDAELAVAREHGWGIVNLGARILRVETAAVAAMASVALTAIDHNDADH